MTDNIATTSNAVPAIITDAERYGRVEQKDIERFREVYAHWPKKYRELIENAGIVFALCDSDLEVARDKIVPVNVNQLHGQPTYSNGETVKRSLRKNPDLSLYKALLVAIGTGEPSVDWQPARRETQKMGAMGLSSAFIPEVILWSVATDTKDRRSTPFGKIYVDYMQFADREYEKLRNEWNKRLADEHAAKYQADDTRFTVNEEPGVLTELQQQYFQTVNELIGKLHVTPKQFDDQCRFISAYAIHEASLDTTYLVLPHLHKGAPGATVKLPDKSERRQENGLLLDLPFKLGRTIAEGKPTRERAIQAVRGSGFDSPTAVALTELLDSYLGVYNTPTPEQAEAWETRFTKALDTYKGIIVKAVGMRPELSPEQAERTPGVRLNLDHSPSETANILQRYASGFSPLTALEKIRPSITYNADAYLNPKEAAACSREVSKGGGYFVFPSASAFLHASIKNSAIVLARKKGIPEADIEKDLEKLDSLRQMMRMGLGAYQPLPPIEKEKIEEAENPAEKSAREREATRPQAFAVTSGVHARIAKTASRDIHPRTPADERALIKNMQALRDVIQPFAHPENMDIKIPQHKALGEALFNDAILAQVEYAFRPGGNGAPACEPALKEHARAAIQAVYALNEQTPNLVSEELGDNEALRTELRQTRIATNTRLKRLLEQSPAIVIASIGSAAQVLLLKEWEQTILSENNSNAEAQQNVRRRMRNMSYALLNEVGAAITMPPLDTAAITADGRLIVTESGFLLPADRLILTLKASELDSETLSTKLMESDEKIRELIRHARIVNDKPAIEQLQTTQQHILDLFDNQHREQEIFIQRVRTALTGNEVATMPLSEAVTPPPLPPTPPTPHDNPMEWDDIRRQAERFIERVLQEDGANPYAMFRCRLRMEPGHPLTMELARWMGNDTQTGRETCNINCADLNNALDIKKRLQAYVLNLNQDSPDISENLARLLAATPLAAYRRRHHVGFYQAMAEDILPDTMPRIDPQRPEPDGQPGRVDNRGNGLWSLRLLFPDRPDTPNGPETTTETFLSLGVEQAGSRDMANARRLMVLDYLQQLREQNQQHIATQHPEQVRRVTGQDVQLWLSQQIHALNDSSQAAQTASPGDPRPDQRIRELAADWRQPIPDDITPRNWLAQQVQHLGNRWDSIRVIDLREHQDEFERRVPINIPPSSDGKPRLELYFQNPEFSGVSQFWSVDVDMRLNGKSILKSGRRVNMHISAAGSDGEPGSDTQQILDRLNAIRSFLGDTLNAYGQAYPNADLHMASTSPYLQQYTPQQLRNTPNLDLTRLDILIDALPFAGTMTIDSIIPEGGMTPDRHNNTHFGFGFHREDGSSFQERIAGQQHMIPVLREYTMPICPNVERARNIVQALVNAQYNRPQDAELRMHALEKAERSLTRCESPEQQQRLIVTYFTEYTQHLLFNTLDDKYSPFRDPYYEPQAHQSPATPIASSQSSAQAIARVVALMRHGPALRETPVNGDELMNPLEKYHPAAIIKAFNDALDSATRIANAQEAGIQPALNRTHGPSQSEDEDPHGPRNHHERPTQIIGDELEIFGSQLRRHHLF